MFKIMGTGMYVPKNLVTNEDMYARFGREDLEKVYARIGHGARYYCDPGQCSADLAVEAGKRALDAAGVKPSEIDLLILSTDTPSHVSPATAHQVMHRLEAFNAGGFDVNSACSGFVAAMDIAGKFLDGQQYRTALVIGSYAMSKYVDHDDPKSAPLFGDGAGAFVIRHEERGGKFSSVLLSDSQYWDYMGIYAGASKHPVTPEILAEKKHCVKFVKKYPPTLNREKWPALVGKTLSRIGKNVEDVDLFIFTQIRKFTIEEVMGEWGLPMEKTHTVMEKWGYTGSACIPMAFHDALETGKVKRGDRVLLCASGGGFSMACMSFEF